MKKIAPLLFLFLMLLAACASQARPTEDPATEAPLTQPAEAPGNLGDVLVRRLSENLGLDTSAIVVKTEKETVFTNACLDLVLPEVACAEVMTPGRIFILEANGMEYEYHATEAGDLIQPATLALIWTREGGIAGFCDRLTVYLSGEVYASNCRSQPEQTSGSIAGLLTVAQIKEFNAWYLEYGKTALDESDPAGVSDRMTNTLDFFGTGTAKPGRADQQALFDWAKTLFQKLNS
jgi:hypothetical protein